MTTESLPIGPDPEAITQTILETWPETDVVEALGGSFFSLDPEKHWPNFATIVTTDEHDEGAPSNLSRPGVFRLNIGVGRETFQRLVGEMVEPDYAAFERILPHPVYAKQIWISILNPSDATYRDVVMPLLTEAHDRLAAARARHPNQQSGDMTDSLRVILEIGKKKRIVAGAMDWPGLDRWGTSEDGAIETMVSYRPRYAGVAERAGMAKAFVKAGDPRVVERVPGVGSTDFWGIAHAPSEIEREVLSETDLERRLDLLQACWAYFDDVAGRVSPELRLGPRGGGRSRDGIIGHVHRVEPGQFSDKVEVRTPIDVSFSPDELVAHREAFLAAIRAYNAEGKPARTWPIQFLIRRVAHHVMDHAWEMEDRDLTPS